jgi:hypothetical protein
MKVWSHLALALVVSTAALAGTALADNAWEEIVSESEARVGTTPARAADPAAQQAIIGDLLADGLTRDEAVELALRNNSRLQEPNARLRCALPGRREWV